jgi:hypothetical protein
MEPSAKIQKLVIGLLFLSFLAVTMPKESTHEDSSFPVFQISLYIHIENWNSEDLE